MSGHGRNKKLYKIGLSMLITFVLVLVIVFMPVFGGKNGLDYLDNLYNSISKASAYYIPDLKEEGRAFKGQEIRVTLSLKDKGEAIRAAHLFVTAGAEAVADGSDLKITGDLGTILDAGLQDADDMFYNRGDVLVKRYQGQNERVTVYTWWASLKAMQKPLNRQKAFVQAKFVKKVQGKAVEMSYNYYKIEPQSIGQRWGIVFFSLLFYVIYTMWYGYGVMYLFEGTGYRFEH